MKKIYLLMGFIIIINTMTAQNVGIGTTAPISKLHIKGTADSPQFIIDGHNTQSNTSPLLKLRKSDGTDLMWIHSDDPTNVFIGINAGRVNNPFGGFGASNIFIGNSSGYSNASGSENTATGTQSLYFNTSGVNNTATGYAALFFNNGNNNTATGSAALANNSTGNSNTATGTEALFFNESGVENTANGWRALQHNTTGYYNTATGVLSLSHNNIGYFNTATGYAALNFNESGIHNVANGVNALYFNSTGDENTANGNDALVSNITGSNNTAIGRGALYFNTTGVGNTALGYRSGNTDENLSNTVGIGNIGFYAASSNQVIIGNASTVSIGGKVNWGIFSDARIKNNIKEDVKGLDFILRLRPVTYHISNKAISDITKTKDSLSFAEKYDGEKITYSGFLAQEVEQAAITSKYDFSGYTKPKNDREMYSIRYAEFVVPLVKAIQEQQLMIEKLQKQVEVAKAEIPTQLGKQQAIIEKQQQQISALQNDIKELKTITQAKK